ncbi:MAG: hypothetical protein NVSMB47_04980 [Polyangiales bacterium]
MASRARTGYERAVRSVVYRYDDLQQLADAVDRAKGQGLALPAENAVRDGEWVLAIFELGGTRRATAAAGRGALLDDGSPALLFERRDWDRLRQFATATVTTRADSETRMTTAAAVASHASSSELPIDSDTARSGVHPVEIGEPPLPAEALLSSAETASLRSTQSWESRPRSMSPPAPARGGELSVAAPAPPAPPPIVQPSQAPRARLSGGGSTVLIVDDDEDLREVIAAMLETVGLRVIPAGSAEEGLDIAHAQAIDLLLLDWSLPGMNGLELCRVVRTEPRLAGLPVRFLTAHSATQDMVEAFAAGADDFVTQPFRAAELGARIFGLLRRSRVGTPRDAH